MFGSVLLLRNERPQVIEQTAEGKAAGKSEQLGFICNILNTKALVHVLQATRSFARI
jgi:hypothetical protein